jgi:hypothetical protein
MSTTAHTLVAKTLVIVKGCAALNLAKNAKGVVTEVAELGPEYSHCVKVRATFGGRNVTLYARHINRLSDATFNLNNGNPNKMITVRPS